VQDRDQAPARVARSGKGSGPSLDNGARRASSAPDAGPKDGPDPVRPTHTHLNQSLPVPPRPLWPRLAPPGVKMTDTGRVTLFAPAPPAAPRGRLGEHAVEQPAPKRSRRSARPLLALAGGLLLFAAFPPVGLWWAAPLAVALVSGAVAGTRPRRAYGLGLLFALAFLLPLLAWSRVAGLDAWLILTLSQTLLVALVGPVTALTMRLPGAPVWVATSWTLTEAVRGRAPFGGFPWGRLAFSQGHGSFVGLAALGGAPLVTFAVALSGGLLAAAALRLVRGRAEATGAGSPTLGRVVPARVAALAAAALLVALGGSLVFRPVAPQPGSAVVAAVQGNVPRRGLEALGQKRAVTANHAVRTEALARDVAAGRVAAPDLVLWPENSSDVDPFLDPVAADLLSQASAAVQRPLLVGAVLQGPGPGHVRNAGLLWGPAGYLGQTYVKQHPVPFAEYLPGRPVLEQLVHRFRDLMPNDFVAGRSPGVLDIPTRLTAGAPAVRIGDVICFEVAYDSIVRTPVQRGARLLVVQTNNATFGRSGETYQQLEMSRLRAVEHGRAVVVVSTSGVSALINPDGSVLTTASPFTAAALVRSLPLRTSTTLADRVGEWPEGIIAGVGLLALLIVGLGGVRGRRRGTSRGKA